MSEMAKTEMGRILDAADEMFGLKVRCMDCGALIQNTPEARTKHDGECPRRDCQADGTSNLPRTREP